MQRQRGLTLLELLVVMAIIGLSMAGVSLALRDNSQTQLQREAQRLVALLEAARAQSRTSGVALIWELTTDGFVIRAAHIPLEASQNTPPAALADLGASPRATGDVRSTGPMLNLLSPRQTPWLNAATQARIPPLIAATTNAAPPNAVVLGPEPILAPARITLSVLEPATQRQTSVTIGTDGLRPFQVLP